MHPVPLRDPAVVLLPAADHHAQALIARQRVTRLPRGLAKVTPHLGHAPPPGLTLQAQPLPPRAPGPALRSHVRQLGAPSSSCGDVPGSARCARGQPNCAGWHCPSGGRDALSHGIAGCGPGQRAWRSARTPGIQCGQAPRSGSNPGRERRPSGNGAPPGRGDYQQRAAGSGAPGDGEADKGLACGGSPACWPGPPTACSTASRRVSVLSAAQGARGNVQRQAQISSRMMRPTSAGPPSLPKARNATRDRGDAAGASTDAVTTTSPLPSDRMAAGGRKNPRILVTAIPLLSLAGKPPTSKMKSATRTSKTVAPCRAGHRAPGLTTRLTGPRRKRRARNAWQVRRNPQPARRARTQAAADGPRGRLLRDPGQLRLPRPQATPGHHRAGTRHRPS